MSSNFEKESRLTPAGALSLVHFMHIAERLKDELRHSFTSGGRQESVAEHCWRVALLALLMKPYLPGRLDWERLLEMLIVHDLAEARTGDVPIFDARHGNKAEEERMAMNGYRELLPNAMGERISDLWEEFEAQETIESKIANALDKLEASARRALRNPAL
jgi:putative hydrolase of HD superfamily